MLALLLISGAGAFAAIPLKDVANDATDPNNLSDTEPSIAVNPANPQEIAIVSFSEGWDVTTPAPVWKSADGGATWTKERLIPQSPTSASGPGDQKLAYDAAGHLFVAELGFDVLDFVARQTGLTNTPLTAGATYGNDQPHIAVDNSSTGTCAHRLYSPWLDTTQLNAHSMVSDSDNKGVTLTTLAAGDNAAFPNRTTRIAVAPDGKAYVVYKTREGAINSDFETVHFRVARSDDCGASWNALGAGGVSVHGTSPVTTYFTQSFGNSTKGFVNRARSSDAWIAVSPITGAVSVAFVNKDASGFAQIYVATSTNQGATWNSERATDGTHNSAFPEIAVNDDGRIGVLFIDYDDSGAATLFRHHLLVSPFLGTQWVDEVLQTMDPSTLSNALNGFIWGDYEGLTAHGTTFYGVFTGESIGRTIKQLDPIFFSAAFLSFNIPKLIWERDTRYLKIPVPWPCLQCPPVPNFNIAVDGDRSLWSVRLVGRGAERTEQRQRRTSTGVTIHMRAAVKSLEGLLLQFKRTERARVDQAYQVKIAVTSAAH